MKSVYVFRVGPVTEDGDFLFLPIVDDEVLPIVHATTDAEGMQAMAEQLRGWELTCEPRLAEAGAAFGFVGRDMPVAKEVMRAAIAMRIHLIPEFASIQDLLVYDRFLHAAGHFWIGTSRLFWPVDRAIDVSVEGTLTASFEGMIVRDPEPALVLFDQVGSVDRYNRTVQRPAFLNETSNYRVVFESSVPAYVVEAIQPRYTLDVLPHPLRTHGGAPARLGEDELLVVSAALLGMANVEEIGRPAYGLVEVDGKTLRAFVK